MSLIVTLEADIKEGKTDALIAMLNKLLPETRTYKGFIDISIHLEQGSNHVLFFEKWVSVEDYESYLAWRTDTGVMEQLGSLFKSIPLIRYYKTAKT